MKTSKKRRTRQPPTASERSSPRGRPKGTGSHTIYASLKQRILRLDLAPGADIDEQALVRQFKLNTYVKPFIEYKPRPDLNIRFEVANPTHRNLHDVFYIYPGLRTLAGRPSAVSNICVVKRPMPCLP